MITLRSLPPGAMGPAPHHNPYRHDRDRPPWRTRNALTRVRRRAAGIVRRRPRPEAAGNVAPASAPTLAD